MGSLLERLVFGKREHNDRLVTFARDNDWRVVLTNAVHRVGKIFSRFSVSDRLHNMDRILYSRQNAICSGTIHSVFSSNASLL